MSITYRRIETDGFEPFLRAAELAFSSAPTSQDVERERTLHEPDRSFAAFDGERIVGTNAAFTMPISVPGAEVGVGFLTLVGVASTHRRRGINTELMRRQLDDAHARGEPLSVLVASEGTIYGRYGYAVSGFDLSIDVANARSAFVPGVETGGTIELAAADVPIREILAVNELVRAERPGIVALDERRYRYWIGHEHGPDKELTKLFAVHRDAGAADGYVAYRVKHDWEDATPASKLEVLDLQATNPVAYASLWRHVFDVDLIERTTAWARPVDEPLLRLLLEPRRLRAKLSDGLWVRLVDVAAALGSRRYAAAGRVVLEVADAFCPWNAGRYLVATQADGTAEVAPTEEDADLACTVNELGAAFLGGTSFRGLRRAGLVEERSDGGCARADALFAWDPAPWSPYDF